MRFGLMQVALGIALLSLGPIAGGAAWLLAWPGASVLAIGLAYLAGAPGVFGKDASTGRLTAWKVALLFPYVVVAWSLWQLKSRLGRENAHDEVAPGIHVGRRPLDATEVPADARVIVDLTSELARSPHTVGPARYLCLPTLDTSAPPEGELEALLEVLSDAEGPLFVHCAMGHGRSATVAAALMIRRGLARDLGDALSRMKAARPAVHLHAIQRSAVILSASRAPRSRVQRAEPPRGTVSGDEAEGADTSQDRADREPDPA